MATTTKTRCEVVDQILAWTTPDGTLQIEPGDLIVHDGAFEQLADVDILEGGEMVCYRLADLTGTEFAGVEELVAVRRYVETTEE